MKNTIEPDGLYWWEDVARILFGRSLAWFYRYRETLIAEENFPHPISKIGRPRWAGRALIAWRDRPPSRVTSMGVEKTGAVSSQDDDAVQADYTALLRERARIIARSSKSRPRSR